MNYDTTKHKIRNIWDGQIDNANKLDAYTLAKEGVDNYYKINLDTILKKHYFKTEALDADIFTYLGNNSYIKDIEIYIPSYPIQLIPFIRSAVCVTYGEVPGLALEQAGGSYLVQIFDIDETISLFGQHAPIKLFFNYKYYNTITPTIVYPVSFELFLDFYHPRFLVANQ